LSKRYLTGYFDNEHDIIEVTRESRESGMVIEDVYAPYAVHHLDRAQGLKPSRLTWACFAFGFMGGLLMLLFQFWTSAVDWPINVGGRPWNSLPAFIPVTFELVILTAGLGVVFTFFVVSRLYPGKKNKQPSPSVTNDRFALRVELKDKSFVVDEILKLWKKHNLVEFDEVYVEES
jgi:hypothetical protein